MINFQIPTTQLSVLHAKIRETSKSSEDESDNEANANNVNLLFSIEIVPANSDVFYLVTSSSDQKAATL